MCCCTIPDGDLILIGLDLVDEGGFIISASHVQVTECFERNQVPTQFEEVRHAIAYLLDRNSLSYIYKRSRNKL